MSEPLVKLWSYHPSDFSLTSGRVDHSKSEYYQTVKGVPAAYRVLTEKFGTDQFIWCYTKYGEFKRTDGRKIEWEMNVPEHAILRLLDEFVWNKILGQEGVGGPRHLERRWKQESIEKCKDDSQARSDYIKDQREDYWQSLAPTGVWNELFVDRDKYGEEGVCALLRHPVDPSWVVSPRR